MTLHFTNLKWFVIFESSDTAAACRTRVGVTVQHTLSRDHFAKRLSFSGRLIASLPKRILECVIALSWKEQPGVQRGIQTFDRLNRLRQSYD